MRLQPLRLADRLYAEFGVDEVYCFGSLTDDHGERFTETSDIDIAVKGLPAGEQFEAETELEPDVVEPNEEFRELAFDLIRTEKLDAPWSQTRHARVAVQIPRSGRG